MHVIIQLRDYMDLHGFENQSEGSENTRVTVLLVLFHESLSVWHGQQSPSLWPQYFCFTSQVGSSWTGSQGWGEITWIIVAIMVMVDLCHLAAQHLDSIPTVGVGDAGCCCPITHQKIGLDGWNLQEDQNAGVVAIMRSRVMRRTRCSSEDMVGVRSMILGWMVSRLWQHLLLVGPASTCAPCLLGVIFQLSHSSFTLCSLIWSALF